MSITTSSEWDSLVSSSRSQPVPVVRLYYGDETAYIGVSTKDVDFDGDRYLGVLKNFPVYEAGLDMKAHSHSIGTVNLEIDNKEYQPGSRFSDLMTSLGSGNDIGFYNRKVEARLYIPGITTWANAFPLFSGYIRAIKQNRDEISVDCEDGSEIQHLTIPDNPITTADAPGSTAVPSATLGKQKPIVYGDRRLNLGNSSRSLWTASRESLAVPCIPIGVDDDGEYWFLISGHKLDSIDGLWAHDPAVDRLVEFGGDFTIQQNTSSGALISISYAGPDITTDSQAVSDQQTEANSVAGWTNSGGSISSVTSSEGFSPQSGTYMMKLDSSVTYVYQSVTIESGKTYRVVVYVRTESVSYPASVVQLKVGTSANGTQYGSSSYLSADGVWQRKVVEFTATGTTAYITITGAGSGSTYVDNVSLKESTPYFYDYWFSDGAQTQFTASSDWVNPEYAGDRTLALETTIDKEFGGAPLLNGHVLGFPPYSDKVEDSAIDAVDVFAFARRIDTTSPGIRDFTINDETVTETSATPDASQYGSCAASKDGVEEGVRFYFEVGVAGEWGQGEIEEIYKRIKYYPENPEQLELYASVRGYEYGTWINSRTGHADNNTSGAVIENPAGILESILRDQMGLATANIDTAAFNTASSSLSSYENVLYIDENVNTKDIIERLCRDSRSYVFPNSGRTWSIKVIADTYSAENLAISYDEVKDLEFDTTDPNDIATDVTISYYPSAINGKNQLEATGTAASAVQTYYNITQAQGALRVEADTLKTNASDLQTFMQRNMKFMHNLSTGTVDKQYLSLDIGDVVAFSNMPFDVRGEDITANATRLTTTIYKYWFVFGVKRGRNLEFSVYQLHNLS